MHRAALGGKAATARLALFAPDGFSERVRARAAADVALVAVADLFA